jgi:hypothetical protein
MSKIENLLNSVSIVRKLSLDQLMNISEAHAQWKSETEHGN